MQIVSCFAFHPYHILTSTENGSGKIIHVGKRGQCACTYEPVCTHVVSYGFEEEIYDSISFTFSVPKNSCPCSRYKERGDYKIVKNYFPFIWVF